MNTSLSWRKLLKIVKMSLSINPTKTVEQEYCIVNLARTISNSHKIFSFRCHKLSNNLRIINLNQNSGLGFISG